MQSIRRNGHFLPLKASFSQSHKCMCSQLPVLVTVFTWCSSGEALASGQAPSPLPPPQAKPHAGLYNRGVIASDGARMSNTHASALERLKCCMHSLHKLPFWFNSFNSHSRTKNLVLFFMYTFAQRRPKCNVSYACKNIYTGTHGTSRLKIQGTLHLFELFHPWLGSLSSFPVSPPHCLPLEKGQCLQIDRMLAGTCQVSLATF